MSDRIRELEQLLKVAEQRQEQERQAREAAEQQQEEERRAREEERLARKAAEKSAASALPQNLPNFLEGCHQLYRHVIPVTDFSTATGGYTVDPVHRLSPQRITPWVEFQQSQRDAWDQMEGRRGVWDDRSYPSISTLEYLARTIDPVASEDELRVLERLTVENMV